MRNWTLGLVLAATATSATAAPEFRGRPDLSSNPLPFSDAVKVGDLLFMSGQIGLVDGKVPPTIEAQTKAAMEGIGRVLKANGRSYDDVVKCTVMLDDIGEWAAFNKVYVTYFKPTMMPARSAFGADGLALGAKVEIECIAWAGAGK